jgi:hypothetical protein
MRCSSAIVDHPFAVLEPQSIAGASNIRTSRSMGYGGSQIDVQDWRATL